MLLKKLSVIEHKNTCATFRRNIEIDTRESNKIFRALGAEETKLNHLKGELEYEENELRLAVQVAKDAAEAAVPAGRPDASTMALSAAVGAHNSMMWYKKNVKRLKSEIGRQNEHVRQLKFRHGQLETGIKRNLDLMKQHGCPS